MNPRILHVSAVDFTASKLLGPQLHSLASCGFDVRLACSRTTDTYWRDLDRFHPVDVPFPRRLQPARMLAASRELSRFIAVWRPDVVHLHTPAASLPLRALPHPSWPRGIRLVYTVHGYLHQWPPKGLQELLVQRIEKLESRRTDLTLFQSKEDLAKSEEQGYMGRLRFLGNGVEDQWFNIDPPPHAAPLAVLFVGRLVRGKGILDLLEAVRRTPAVHLHVAGEALPSDRDTVAAEIKRLLETPELTGRVSMHGMLTRAELIDLYGRCNVMCLPSYREGVPRSVIEGLAAARPVVATDIRGCRELVRHGSNGFLVPTHCPASLAEKFGQLARMQPYEFLRMSQRARSSMDPIGRETEVVKRLVSAYAELGVVGQTIES